MRKLQDEFNSALERIESMRNDPRYKRGAIVLAPVFEEGVKKGYDVKFIPS